MDQRTALPLSAREYPDHPFLAVSIAVFREGKALVATRTKPPGADLWSLPGGVVECGESLEAAALRELHEEVGVSARILAFNRHVERIDRDDDGGVQRHFVVASFVGVWTGGEAQTGPEAGAVRWIDPREVADLPTTPGLAEVLASAARILERSAR
ncbi:MAG: NUDIX hydrolase [Hyphomicrobiales bacterium]|nr:NUDIX hydrolase [Hyphomicrobiales bacterium]